MTQKKHKHEFVETFQGLPAFGLDRETDEKTIIYYLQKFSDDALMETIVKRFSDSELEELFNIISRLLRAHLEESEYHQLFLKDAHYEMDGD